MFLRLAALAERRAPLVLVGWLGVAVALSIAAPSLRDVGIQDTTEFLPSSAPSFRADELQRRLFPDDPTRQSALLVFRRPGGLTDADRAYLGEVANSLHSAADRGPFTQVLSAETAPDLAPLLRSADGQAELVLVGTEASPFSELGGRSVEELRNRLDRSAPPGLEHHVTGLGGMGADLSSALVQSFDRTALLTLVLVVAILLFVYRSAVAPLVPLVTIGLAFLVSRGLIALLAERGFQVASMAETFMVVMVFGAGTDYCLFVVSRYREELEHGDPPRESLRRTMGVVGAVITASAATVIVGFLSQTTARFGMYRTFGPAMGIAIFITLVAGLTLTPALLRLAGRLAFWPSSTRPSASARTGEGPSRWERVAVVVRRRPREVLLAGAVLLLLPAGGLGWAHTSYDMLSDLPPSADARRGFEVLGQHFAAGQLSPIAVVVADRSPILTDAKLAAVDRLTESLRRVPGVAEVRSLTQPAGAPLTPELLDRFTGGTGADPAALGLDPNTVDVGPLMRALSAPGGLRFSTTILETYPVLRERVGPFLGADGRSTRVIVALDGNPFDRSALATFRRIDDVAAQALAGSDLSGARLAVGGSTSFFADMQAIGEGDFRRMTAALVGGIFVVLALLLRSLVAPFYLLATVLLSYFATLGVTVAVFQGVFGARGLMFWLPPLLFIILVALGADYNIFITSRIREELDRGLELSEAVGRGLVATGRVITSAGLILAGTFAALMAAPLGNLRQVGFAVTFGVLFDTFVVRTLLVPAATLLLGRWAFWPGSLRRARREPRPALVVGGALAALGVVLVFLVTSAGGISTVDRVPGKPPPGAALLGATGAATGTVPTTLPVTATTAGQPAPAASAAGTGRADGAPASPSPTSPGSPPGTGAPQGPTRVAVPATGAWRYHVVGTRKVGLAGSPQPVDEDVTTEVSRTGGTDDAPEMRLYTRTGSGTEDDVRRYGAGQVEMLSTNLSGFGISFGGTFQPPQVLVRWPVRVGDAWASDWTAGDTRGHTSSRVTGERSFTLGSLTSTCSVVESTSDLSGDASGTETQAACWAVELGIAVEIETTADVTYQGVPVEIDEHRVLTARP